MPEPKRVEGKLHFENEQGLRRNLILSTYRFLSKNNAQAREIPQSIQLNRDLFLQRHNQPVSWNLEYTIHPDHLEVSLTNKYFDMEVRFEEKEPWQMEEPARQPIDLADILNPVIIWHFPSPAPDYVRAYWFKNDNPDEHTLTFLSFTEKKIGYDNIAWLTERLAEHFKAENKKVRAEISLDGELKRLIE